MSTSNGGHDIVRSSNRNCTEFVAVRPVVLATTGAVEDTGTEAWMVNGTAVYRDKEAAIQAALRMMRLEFPFDESCCEFCEKPYCIMVSNSQVRDIMETISYNYGMTYKSPRECREALVDYIRNVIYPQDHPPTVTGRPVPICVTKYARHYFADIEVEDETDNSVD